MIYGYARVSTVNQDLETQIQQLEEARCDVIFKEKFTGTTKDREQLQLLLKEIKQGDTLIVSKLDRIARSARDAMEIIQILFNKKIKVHVLNMGLVEDTPTGRLIFNIMSSFAEFERDMIVERTQEGRALARSKAGYQEGRPNKFTKKQIEHAIKLKETHTFKEVEAMTGIGRTTLWRHMNKREAKQIMQTN